jgi:hypothetical protein
MADCDNRELHGVTIKRAEMLKRHSSWEKDIWMDCANLPKLALILLRTLLAYAS